MNREVNLEILQEQVSTQYGDLTGIIQIDGHNSVVDLFRLCGDHGIDMENHFMLAFGMSEVTITGIGQSKVANCRVVLLPRKKYGNTYDEIKASLINNGGKAEAIEIHFEVNYSSLTKYIKRFDFLAASDMSQHVNTLEITDTQYRR